MNGQVQHMVTAGVEAADGEVRRQRQHDHGTAGLRNQGAYRPERTDRIVLDDLRLVVKDKSSGQAVAVGYQSAQDENHAQREARESIALGGLGAHGVLMAVFSESV